MIHETHCSQTLMKPSMEDVTRRSPAPAAELTAPLCPRLTLSIVQSVTFHSMTVMSAPVLQARRQQEEGQAHPRLSYLTSFSPTLSSDRIGPLCAAIVCSSLQVRKSYDLMAPSAHPETLRLRVKQSCRTS